MSDWDESEHPRDRRGRFAHAATGGWAAQTISNMGLADPEFQGAMQLQQQWVVDTLDAIEGVLGEPGRDPYWMNHHHERLTNFLRAVPAGFERDPRLPEARKRVADTLYAEDGVMVPWHRPGAMTEDQIRAAYPFWRAEVARLLRREGYDLDAVEEHFKQAGLSHLATDEQSFLEQNHIDRPALTTKFLTRELEKIPPDQGQGWLRTAAADFDNYTEGDHGGKQLKASQLDEHPDFATSGEFEIWLDGDWHLLEEVYHDDPDEEEIEIIAGDQHLVIDTSDDIELRRIPIEQRPRRRWWE